MIYIRVTLPGCNQGYVDTVEGVKEFIDVMAENAISGDFNGYEFTPVEMDENDFENLPEFQGF